MIEKTCKTCSEKFVVHNYRSNSANYCCHGCYSKSREIRKESICPVCKNKFVNKFNTTFCSVSCRAKSQDRRIEKKCLNCQKTIKAKKSLLERKKYCSQKCKAIYQQTSMAGEGNPFYGKTHSPETMERIKKKLTGRIGPRMEKAYSWKGGTMQHQRGYVSVYLPNHPHCTSSGYVRRSRLVMGQMLGRHLLPEEVVHHINGNTTDDRPGNLQYWPNQSAHQTFHRMVQKSKHN